MTVDFKSLEKFDFPKPNNVPSRARLILNFDPTTNLFNGTVENTTNATLNRVRVEIHLSNGTELGPTKPTDISVGKKVDIILDATGEVFDTFSAHPEVG